MTTTEDHKDKQVYELGYLILPSIAEDSLSDVVNAIKGIINKSGGEEVASEDPIKTDLAYEMSKTIGARKYVVNDAYIGWVKFECEPSCVPEIDSAVKLLDEVLRFLLIKTERETYFTFADARKREEEREQALAEAAKALETPEAAPAEKAQE
jgi:small subunit ribosomal protein S6